MAKLCVLFTVGVTLTVHACASESTMPPPRPERASPHRPMNNVDVLLTIEGDGFIPIPVRRLAGGRDFETRVDYSVQLYKKGRNGAVVDIIDLVEVERHDSETLYALLKRNAPQGSYGIRVISPIGTPGEKDDAIEITDAEKTDTDDTTFTTDSEPDLDPDDFDYFCGLGEDCTESCSDDTCLFGCTTQLGCDFECRASTCETVCAGSGECSVDCNASRCNLACNGSGNCAVNCSSGGCTAENNGTGILSVWCNAGGCAIDCTGNRRCQMTCETENCEIDCDGDYRQCDANRYVCNTDCPAR